MVVGCQPRPPVARWLTNIAATPEAIAACALAVFVRLTNRPPTTGTNRLTDINV